MEENVVSQIAAKPGMHQKWVCVRDLLHVQMWLLAALWTLSRGTVMYQFVLMLKFNKMGKAVRFTEEFKVEDYNYYSAYTLSWIDGVGEYFKDLVGAARMGNFLYMTDVLKDNKGMLEVYTTFCLFLHFSELVRSVQGGNHGAIKRINPSMYHILQVANRYKVAEQLLSVGWYQRVLHPDLYPLYEAEWTKRMSNRESVGVGINKVVEDANQQINRKAMGVQDFR